MEAMGTRVDRRPPIPRRVRVAVLCVLAACLAAPAAAVALEVPVEPVLDLTDPVTRPLQEVVESVIEPVSEPVAEPVEEIIEQLPVVSEVLGSTTPDAPAATGGTLDDGAHAGASGTATAPTDVAAPGDGATVHDPPASTGETGGETGAAGAPAPAPGPTVGTAAAGTGEQLQVSRPPPLTAFAAGAAEEFRFPLLIMAGVIVFLLASGQLVPRDRKALARTLDDPGLGFR
jgi:hypothetical protein